MLRSILRVGLLAALASFPSRVLHAEDRSAWQQAELEKLAGRWTTVREEKSAAGKLRKTRVELEFADGVLKMEQFDAQTGKPGNGDKLKVIGIERVQGPGPGSFARLQVGGNPQQKSEVSCDFVGEKLILVGRIGWRPWEGFSLSGEFQRAPSSATSAPESPQASAPKPGGPSGAPPADLHVDDDNAGAQDGSALHPYRTVQQAIDSAKGNAVVAVAGGTYAQNILLRDKAVRLYGGYVGGTKAGYAGGTAGNFKTRDPAANPSRLKGNGKDSVVTMSEPGASIVDGFLITGGGRSSLAAPSFLGGGVYVYGGSPTISNNVIEKNQTCPPVQQDQEKLGGGIYSTGANISILNNVIRNNVSGRGAGIAADGPKVVIRGNLVQGNIGVGDHGGGIYLFSPNAEISRNRIVDNEIGRALGYGWGGGIIVFNKPGSYKFSHNIFTGNFAPSVGSAVFVDDGAIASLDHDLIYANACNPTGDGAVAPVYVDGLDDKLGSTLTINHVTIADHACKPAVAGYAIGVTGLSEVVVKNSILWNNGGDDVKVDATSRASVTYTLTQKVVKGVGNLSKDPLFANPAGRDCHLRSTAGRWDPAANGKKGGWTLDQEHSPGIDAADPASPFKAEPAPNGGRANLGAYGNTSQASKSGNASSGVKAAIPGG